jgi:hypothetical protein
MRLRCCLVIDPDHPASDGQSQIRSHSLGQVMVWVRRQRRGVPVRRDIARHVQVQVLVAVHMGVSMQHGLVQPAVFEHQRAVDKLLEEAAIMGDDEHRLIEGREVGDETGLAGLIETGGGLVEQQHPWLHGQHRG